MLGDHFYHEKFRKAVAIFGTLFNNLYVVRRNNSGGTISSMKVPLSYAPKRSFLERIREQADLDTDTSVAIKLPRMSFEIIAISYDPARQLQKTNNYQSSGELPGLRNKVYSYVPYTLAFQLNIYAKSQDDALQLVEQILPYFNPQFTVTIKPFKTLPDVREDIPVTITGVDYADDYEGALEQRRTIIYTLFFDMKLNLYGPIDGQTVITKSIAKLFDINASADSDLGSITVTPTPAGVTVDSDFGFNTVIKGL